MMLCNLSRVATEAVISEIVRGGFLSGPMVLMRKCDAQLIAFLQEKGSLSNEALRSALHKGICACGRSCYEDHIARPSFTPPDHTLSPEALGYACRHGIVTSVEAARIRFDHGETLREYVEKTENFLEEVLSQITEIAIRPNRERSVFYDPCSCHN